MEKLEKMQYQDIGTNGKLRRHMALSILRKNPKYMLIVACMVIGLSIFSGNGEGINLWGISIKPIAESAMNAVFTLAGVLIHSFTKERNDIINHYFVNEQTKGDNVQIGEIPKKLDTKLPNQ